MYLKFVLYQLKLFLLLVISAAFVYPIIVYPFRKRIWEMRASARKVWYFWFADTYETAFHTEMKNYLNSFYGVYELLLKDNGFPDYSKYFKLNCFQKFILSYRWAVLRNGMWNYIIKTSPPKLTNQEINVITNTGENNPRKWRNKTTFGKQHITWCTDGKKYFRYSFTRKLKKFSLFRLFGKKYINFMAGAGGSNGRYLLKLRIF